MRTEYLPGLSNMFHIIIIIIIIGLQLEHSWPTAPSRDAPRRSQAQKFTDGETTLSRQWPLRALAFEWSSIWYGRRS